mmetsp:Transcript_2665/g.10585  ORF Transcript_2665/g.10585 Transcript_2665/m.10585 type:complete len:273 (-) Transcript_2665:159-977(-)
MKPAQVASHEGVQERAVVLQAKLGKRPGRGHAAEVKHHRHEHGHDSTAVAVEASRGRGVGERELERLAGRDEVALEHRDAAAEVLVRHELVLGEAGERKGAGALDAPHHGHAHSDVPEESVGPQHEEANGEGAVLLAEAPVEACQAVRGRGREGEAKGLGELLQHGAALGSCLLGELRLAAEAGNRHRKGVARDNLEHWDGPVGLRLLRDLGGQLESGQLRLEGVARAPLRPRLGRHADSREELAPRHIADSALHSRLKRPWSRGSCSCETL